MAMILTQEASKQLVQHELYLGVGLEFEGHGYIGSRVEVRAGIASRPASIGSLNNTNLSSYVSAVAGFFHNCSIGSYSSIAEGIKTLGSHDFERLTTSVCTIASDSESTIFAGFKGKSPYIYSYHTMIGHDVWLGSNVQIKGGVFIGHGAIVGAGSIVTKHVPPFAVVAGAPAKIIRMRFSEAEIERILKSQWYLYDWNNIEVDWGNRHNCLSKMEDLIASGNVPLIGSGFAYKVNEQNLRLIPAQWSFEQQIKVSYGVDSLQDVYSLPNVQKNTLS